MALPKMGVELVAEGADRFVSQMGRAEDAQGKFVTESRKVEDAGRHYSVFEEIATGALRRVGELAVNSFLSIGESALGFVQSGLDFNRSMENVTAQLNAFTKDGEKSAEILDMIRDRAARTPFAFEDMARATAGLLPAAKTSGVALEELVAQAEILAASNPAEGLEGAAFALREATGGDFQSAIERFNLPRQLINQLKEEGVPNLEIVRQAMLAMGYDADLVANMAETMDGRWSTFQDTLQGMAAQISEPIFDILKEGLVAVQPLLDDIATNVAPLIAQWLGENIPIAIQKASDFWTTTLQPALTQVWAFIQSDILPMLADVATWLQNNIPVALQIASDIWVNVLQPALAIVWDFIKNSLLPAIGDIVAWLEVNVPIAIQKASDFWENTLRPALEKVWAFIQQNVIPIIEDVVAWLQVNIPIAIQKASDFWTNTLQPALDKVWVFIRDNVIPIIEDVVGWLQENIPIALQKAADFWNDTLKPALETVYEFIRDNVIPVIEDVIGWLEENIPAAIETAQGVWKDLEKTLNDVKVNILDPLVGTFDNIAGAIDGVIQWVGDLITKFTQLELPDWLTPGSPTPFELGLAGINKELAQLAKVEMPALEMALSSPKVNPVLSPAAIAAAGNTYHYQNSTTYTLGGVTSVMSPAQLQSSFQIMELIG